MTRWLTAVFSIGAALLVTGCAEYSKASRKKPSDLAVTREQRTLALAQEKHSTRPMDQIGAYLDAADEARRKLSKDPHNTLWQSDYNFAVARIMEIIAAQRYAPWDRALEAPSADGTPWRLRLIPPFKQARYHPSRFEFAPADRYELHGELVGERVRKSGLGAPIVVIGDDLDYRKLDPFAQGKNVYYGLTAVIRFRGRDCEIVLIDPLDKETVELDRASYPLAGDYQAPLVMALAELQEKELMGLFKPQEQERGARLAKLQPFNPQKIPIICVHGLGNSPATWAPLIEFLRGDEEIRKNYQFWFFSYPSGLPYPLSAAILRNQWQLARRQFPGLKDAVVIGHSMGGMISRLLITDSGMTLWDAYFDHPPEQSQFSGETRELITRSLIFKSTPGVSRVIFVSASHRGSERASSFLGRLGALVVGSPITAENVFREAIQAAKNAARLRNRNRLPNSIDLLDPDSLVVKAVDSLPTTPGVPYHSIIGDRGKGGYLDRTKPESTDGFVPYWSSHMEGAESERIIPSAHWSHLHPLGMAEIKRILLKNLHRD
ncbi:MAG: alpha/beta hydrolase [Chthoniobacterales bacterium]|nr:alpha/beta hydrolase [Chthoniobacterales bacterium]